jgi:transcriptional regulator with XRE-family HTH domain
MSTEHTSDDWYGEDAATFGDRLAAARDAAGLSQGELAERLGVKTNVVRAWEEDIKEPRANRLQMLSGMLNISLSWLLTGVGEGVDGPVEEEEPLDHDVQILLTDMRALRAQISQSAERLAQLEKRLRKSLKSA